MFAYVWPLFGGSNMRYDNLQRIDFAHSAHFLEWIIFFFMCAHPVKCTKDHLRLIQQWQDERRICLCFVLRWQRKCMEAHCNRAQSQARQQTTNKNKTTQKQKKSGNLNAASVLGGFCFYSKQTKPGENTRLSQGLCKEPFCMCKMCWMRDVEWLNAWLIIFAWLFLFIESN